MTQDDLTHDTVAIPDPTIPKISDDRLLDLAARFRHLQFDGTMWRTVETPMTMEYLRRSSCLWAPKLGPSVNISAEARAVPFFVTCGYYGFFKPSIAEVLSQAPVDELERKGFNAFHIGRHVEILRSGSFQRAMANFVMVGGVN